MGRNRKPEKLSLEEYLYLKGYLKNQMSLYKTGEKKGVNKFCDEVFEIITNNDLIAIQKLMQDINEYNARLKSGVSWKFLTEESKKKKI